MSQPFIGEIRIFAGTFAPAGWAFCEGQLIPISENDALFTLIGTTYGGDGQETFGLPDLRGRIPIHQSSKEFGLGEQGGAESVTLTKLQIPIHTHSMLGAAVQGNQTTPQDALPANAVTITPYINQPPDTNFNPNVITPTGGSQPHSNFQPYLCLNFIISLFGIFPQQQ